LLQLLIAFYPETKGKTLEEMDNLFDRLITDSEGGTPAGKYSGSAGPAELDGAAEEQAVINSAKK
jgi:hypothetical protein